MCSIKIFVGKSNKNRLKVTEKSDKLYLIFIESCNKFCNNYIAALDSARYDILAIYFCFD